jgi:hypothetical protein
VQETLKVVEVRPAEQLTTNIFVAMQLVTAGATLQTPYGVILDTDDASRCAMAKLTVKSGKAAGREMVIADISGDVLIPFGEKCPELFEGVEPGDEVLIDNSDWLAFCHLYLHNVEWNVPGLHDVEGRVPNDYERFGVDGNPVHAQTGIAAYDLDEVVAFPGKMIYVGAVLDICIWPTITSSFDHYVRSVLGDTARDHYRLWWVENSTHARAEMACTLTGDSPAFWRTRLVDYEAVGAAALTAVRNWVEEGIEPLADSAYSLTPDKDIVLESDPKLRGGVQPVVELTVDGHDRIEVLVGSEVHFTGKGTVPTGAGTIVEAEMDFEGIDTWPFQAKGADGSTDTLDVKAVHTFNTPGTYFPVLRIGSHADGATRSGEAIRNLARVRVVVGE